MMGYNAAEKKEVALETNQPLVIDPESAKAISKKVDENI